ncbi:hypothetical protein CLOM_g16757 [Closterium sp. NIES-68]|nr:hypothetical protein CLOM_g16757 [Closterium sp. NIES-68]GJP71985.1 hypothetical protein CLOP_g2763 [Closterium sp. NIES-67]
MGPPASSRLSRVRCAERVQCAEPYTPLVSAKSATESLFSPRSSSAESDDLYPDSPIAGSPHDDLSQQTGPPRMARHSGESSHPRESPRQTGARERRGPAGYNLRGDQRQQPYEYTHCHTWQAGGRETGAAETGRGPLASSGSCRTNGRNLGVSGEKLTGVGRSLAGSGRRASGRLCRKMEDDDVEDQRPGKGGGSGRLHRSMEDDDVADDGTLPRQRAPGGVSLSTAYGNPSHRLARRLEDDERQQECSRRGQPIPQAQKTAANQLHRSLEDDEYYQHGSTRVPASASLHSDVRDCRDSLRAGRAGSAGRVATGSLSRAAQAAGAGADGAAIRQSSRLCRSLERDEMAAQEASWQEKVGTWQVDGLDSAGQHGLVGGRKMPSHSARFGEVHAEGVTSEGCVAGRGSVRGGQREGEQGPGVQGKRQPMRPCRSLEEDDREDGIMVGGKSKSSGRLERRLEDDEDDDDEGTNGASGELQQLHRRLERHLSDDDDDEEDRAVYIKSRESNGQVTSKEVRGHGQAGAEKDTHKSKGLIKRLFIFQRD